MSDWIEWDGSAEAPVPAGTLVQVRLGWQPGSTFSGYSDDYDWTLVMFYCIPPTGDAEGEEDGSPPTD